LDNASPDHPVVIVRMCNHISVMNSQGLEQSALNDASENPPGGKLGRKEDGRLNGILYEKAHMKLSKFYAHSEDEIIHALSLSNELFVSQGITSVHDAGGYSQADELVKAMKIAIEQDKVQVRIYSLIGSLTD